ncbi:MAG: proton-conducting transporter membrane subunit [bacterium]
MNINYLPLYAVLIPFLGALTLIVVGKLFPESAYLYTTINNFLIVIIIVSMFHYRGKILFMEFDTGLPFKLSFRVDILSLVFGLISSIIWTLVSLYSMEYMEKRENALRYNVFSLLTLTGVIGVFFAGDLFTLYIFFELLTTASFMLIIHDETYSALRSGMGYLFMGIGGGLLLLLAIILTYHLTGRVDFLTSGMGLAANSRLLPIIFLGYIIGFGVKAGLFPFHAWMPKVYPITPMPAVALSSGVMIKVGAYGILRTIYSVFGTELLTTNKSLINILLSLAILAIFIGSAAAIAQKDLKIMLAYSSMAQMGYIILGITLLSPLGLTGGIVHVFNHAIIKTTLFLCAGVFVYQSGISKLDELKGIGKKMPLVTFCFTLAALSIIGFPPFNGFISKWYLALGALESVKIGIHSLTFGIFAVGMLLLSSFMNLIYFGPIIYNAWFYKTASGGGDQIIVSKYTSDTSLAMLIPIIILAVSTLIFGIFPRLFLTLLPLGIK